LGNIGRVDLTFIADSGVYRISQAFTDPNIISDDLYLWPNVTEAFRRWNLWRTICALRYYIQAFL